MNASRQSCLWDHPTEITSSYHWGTPCAICGVMVAAYYYVYFSFMSIVSEGSEAEVRTQ